MGFAGFSHLRVVTDHSHNNTISNINNINNFHLNNLNNLNNINRNSQSPRNNDINHRHPPFLLHPEPNSSEININISNNLNNNQNNINNNMNGSGGRTGTPPIRTPPQSPRGVTNNNGNNNNNNYNLHDESPPHTPSSPPSWIPEVRLSPPVPQRNLNHNNNMNNNNNNNEGVPHRPLLETRVPVPIPMNLPFKLEPPTFPTPHSPQNIPVPIPFSGPINIPKSPRTKIPPSIVEQTKHEEGETGPIRWEKGPVIGRGGFGCVYMGMRDNGNLIAVKQLELDENEDPKSRAVCLLVLCVMCAGDSR